MKYLKNGISGVRSMLKIKCFRSFGGWGKCTLLICGNKESFNRAAEYLKDKDGASLDDPNFAQYYDNDVITRDRLKLTKKECKELSEMFHRMQFADGYHNYYDTEALDDDLLYLEIRMSHGEYPDEIFEKWD